jgi:hypothetical protein
MRRFLTILLIGYCLLFILCLLHALYAGVDIARSWPVLLITEPWDSLIGLFYVYLTHGYLTDEYWEKLSAAGLAVVLAGGVINVVILWGLSRLFRKAK